MGLILRVSRLIFANRERAEPLDQVSRRIVFDVSGSVGVDVVPKLHMGYVSTTVREPNATSNKPETGTPVGTRPDFQKIVKSFFPVPGIIFKLVIICPIPDVGS